MYLARVSKVPVTNGPKPCSEQQLFGLYMQLKSYFHIVIISVIFIVLILISISILNEHTANKNHFPGSVSTGTFGVVVT